MLRQIEYCTANADLGTLHAVVQLKDTFPQVKFQEWGCLGHCHRCFRVPFVLLNEQHLIEADTAEKLVIAVKEAAEKGIFPSGNSNLPSD